MSDKIEVKSISMKRAKGKTIASVVQADVRPCSILIRFTDGSQMFVNPCCCANVGSNTVGHEEAYDLDLIDEKEIQRFRREQRKENGSYTIPCAAS